MLFKCDRDWLVLRLRMILVKKIVYIETDLFVILY